MPVIGAIPIVMPTFTNTCIVNASTTPPATTAVKRLGAIEIVRRPRQTTSP